MSPSRLLTLTFCLLTTLLVAGCRNGPRAEAVNRESFEQELRQLEEVNFELGLEIEDLRQQLALYQAQRDGTGLKSGTLPRATPAPRSTPEIDDPDRRSDPPISPPPPTDRRGPADMLLPPPTNGPPEVEVPPLELPEISPPNPNIPDAGGPAPPFDPSAQLRTMQPPGDATPLRPASATRITEQAPRQEPQVRVAFHEALTRGLDVDGRPGDEGIIVVVTLVDMQGRQVRMPAQMAVAVVDPQLPREHAKIAHWEFTPEETAAAFGSTPFGEGHFFELLWQRVPPGHADIEVHVQAITPGGQEVRAVRPIRIALTRR
jgi:hypothetical protein